jgi:hypothetical protein
MRFLFIGLMFLSFSTHAMTVAEAKAKIEELKNKQNRTSQETLILIQAIRRLANNFNY